jgi:hypothetical protein
MLALEERELLSELEQRGAMVSARLSAHTGEVERRRGREGLRDVEPQRTQSDDV